VPGVILLEQVALALQAWRGQRLGRISEAKFVAPLLPDQQATVSLLETTAGHSTIRFEIRRDSVLLARGQVEGTT
jgi:3-hydroxymyristoyl/3-hydroxydecanoyl-(acyl carrier protein) dehydratase